jgi:hypothetical protein
VHCWTSSLNTGPEKHLAVELSNVNFIDENGRALLSCMFSQGARLKAQGNLITSGLRRDHQRSYGFKETTSPPR